MERTRYVGLFLLMSAVAAACGSTTRQAHHPTKSTKLHSLTRAVATNVPYKTAPFTADLALKQKARKAIGDTMHRDVSAIECPLTLTLMPPSQKPIRTVLCNALSEAECTQWLVYREGHSLRASLWRYSPRRVCRS